MTVLMRDTARDLTRSVVTALIFVTFPAWFFPASVFVVVRAIWWLASDVSNKLFGE